MIDAVDCAYPVPGQYPTRLVCGYVSGHTAHVWADSEIAEVAKEGKTFLAICTARNTPPSPPLNATDGHNDARDMAGRLRMLNYPKTFPVFYDQEPGIVDAGPAGADAAFFAWRDDMQAAGWVHAFDYRVMRQGADWVADPTGIRPLVIPAGRIGLQWGGNGTFDFDEFANNILGGIMTNPTGWSGADDAHVKSIVLDALGVSPGQTSWAGTRDAILGTVQSLVNYANKELAGESAVQNAILAYLAAHPATATFTDADKQSIAGDIVTSLNSQGITVDPKSILDAMSTRLAA